MIALHSLLHGSTEASAARLAPEVLARLRQAALASSAPPTRGDAGPLYETLLSLGFCRTEVLTLAASLLEHVALDVAKERARAKPPSPSS